MAQKRHVVEQEEALRFVENGLYLLYQENIDNLLKHQLGRLVGRIPAQHHYLLHPDNRALFASEVHQEILRTVIRYRSRHPEYDAWGQFVQTGVARAVSTAYKTLLRGSPDAVSIHAPQNDNDTLPGAIEDTIQAYDASVRQHLSKEYLEEIAGKLKPLLPPLERKVLDSVLQGFLARGEQKPLKEIAEEESIHSTPKAVSMALSKIRKVARKLPEFEQDVMSEIIPPETRQMLF